MKVLIVENNEDQLLKFEKNLKANSYNVSKAMNFTSAAEAIQKEAFDIYIINVLLPDNKGFNLLSKISADNDPKIIFLHSLFSEQVISQHIPANLKNSCHFLKKPFPIKALVKLVWSLKKPFGSNIDCNKFFKDKTFNMFDLPSTLLMAHQEKLTGILKINSNKNEISQIHLLKGSILKVSSPNKKSYLGSLLIEYNVALEEDIESILQEESSQLIGQRLLEKELLNSHMLELILREQIKIRLFEIMSSGRSFSASFEKQEMSDNESVSVDFSKRDLMDWVVSAVITKIDDDFLEKFYNENKCHLVKVAKAEHFFIKNSFIQKYNQFIDTVSNDIKLESLIPQESKFKTLRLIYFGILIKDLEIQDINEKKIDTEQLEQLINSILTKDETDSFGMLNLPWQASTEEVNAKYKQLIKILHSDALPPNIDPEIKKQATDAFMKIQKAYKTLSDKQSRQQHVKKQEVDAFVQVLKVYREGVALINSKKFKEALSHFDSIKKSEDKPKDTILYMLWAQIKLLNPQADNRAELSNIKRTLDTCSSDLKVSTLFWFVNGIFYYRAGIYDRSLHFLNKACKSDKGFKEAHQERTKVSNRLKAEADPKNKGLLSQLFGKKSA